MSACQWRNVWQVTRLAIPTASPRSVLHAASHFRATHADGNYRLGSVNFLEVETWVTRVANEQTVSGSGLFPYVVWKRGELLPKR